MDGYVGEDKALRFKLTRLFGFGSGLKSGE